MFTRIVAAAACACAVLGAGAARGEVVEASAGGFTIRHAVTVKTAPAETYRRLVAVGDWWDSRHTYSGDAKNLGIEARAGGCFCEKLAEQGSVMHGLVVLAQPGKTLRMSAALGPIQELGASGALTWTLSPTPGGGTTVEMTYAVGGYRRDGMNGLAAAVDAVMAEQMTRFRDR